MCPIPLARLTSHPLQPTDGAASASATAGSPAAAASAEDALLEQVERVFSTCLVLACSIVPNGLKNRVLSAQALRKALQERVRDGDIKGPKGMDTAVLFDKHMQECHTGTQCLAIKRSSYGSLNQVPPCP